MITGATSLACCLCLWLAPAAAAYERWTERLTGKISADGVEHFDFFVRDEITSVVLTLTDVVLATDDEEDTRRKSPLELRTRYGSFPTLAAYDQRIELDTTGSTSISIQQLRSGRYFASLRGGLPFDSAPAFVGSRRQLVYSITITYSTCAGSFVAANGTAASDVCNSTAFRSIAPPYASPGQETTTLSAHFKGTSRVYDGCVDVLVPLLTYTFTIPHPQWQLTILLSTTFSSSLRISAVAQYHNRTEIDHTSDRKDVAAQTASIPAGAGFRTAMLRFSAPSTGLWTIAISGEIDTNVTCLENGGAAFALEMSHDTNNCTDLTRAPTNSSGSTAAADAIDYCSLHFHRLTQDWVSTGQGSELDTVFTASDLSAFLETNGSQRLAAGFAASIDRLLAGSNVELRVETSASVKAFLVLARVDAYPTLTQFDYQFTSTDASSAPFNQSNASNNTTLDMAAFVWPPIRYPRIGDWFFLVVTDQNTASLDAVEPQVNLTLRAFGCAEENIACSGHGSCHVGLSAHGLPFSRCKCDYGHAGDQCDQVSVDRTYRGTQIFFAMASNLAIAPVTWLCARRRLIAEALLFLATGAISTLYHACDYDLFCALRYSDLHHLDFALSINTAAVAVVHLSGAPHHIKAGLLDFYLLAIIVLTTDGSSSTVAWIVLAGVLLIQFAMCIAYYIAVGTARVGLGKLIALKSFLFYSKNFDRRYAIAGCVLLTAALCCWFLASSSNYWIVHSAWHVSAMLSLFCFIAVRLNDRYQLVAPGIGVDVLASPPQFRFAVSSVKSVDILEDTSENEVGICWR